MGHVGSQEGVPGVALTYPGYWSDIRDFARHHRLPMMVSNREFVAAGGLISYAPSLREQYRRAAHFVDRILKGITPARGCPRADASTGSGARRQDPPHA
jgi:hypothetical protein